MILYIHANYNKRLGAYKITHVLQRDYGVTISVGRVYRLMKQLQLPKMSTDKPASNKYCDNNAYDNHLNQNFTQRLQILSGLVILLISKQEASGIFFV